MRRFVLLGLLLAACSDSDGSADVLDGAAEPALGLDAALTIDAGVSDASGLARDATATLDSAVALDAGAETDGNLGDAGGPIATDASVALPGWKLVWQDEFEGTVGTLPDPAKWQFETGGSGFGNNQLEFDTDRKENASLDGKGMLVLTARKESYMGRNYTSARLKTQGKFEHSYGRYEARMKIPFGQGIWPAFWMLGVDIGSAGWPACGEIDIMENIGREPTQVHGTLHGPGYSGASGIGAAYELPSKARFADDYHVFAIEWEEQVVRWYVDGKLYQTRAPKDLPAGAKWVYDHKFFILLNLAVGGQWPGNPDGTSTFPQQLSVDYVRVYER